MHQYRNSNAVRFMERRASAPGISFLRLFLCRVTPLAYSLSVTFSDIPKVLARRSGALA
jgi:hypothetical protein